MGAGAGAVSGHRVSPEDNSQLSPTSPLHTSTSAPHNQHHNHHRVNTSTSSQSSPPEGSSDSCRTQLPNSSVGDSGSEMSSVRKIPEKTSCETCDNNFSFFKRKKICKDCRRTFCSTCLPKPPSRQNGRQCTKCTILVSGRFTRDQLKEWKVKDMRYDPATSEIYTSTCKEKDDLINLIHNRFCLESNTVLRERQEHERLVGELADRMRSSSFYSSSTTANNNNANNSNNSTALPHQVPEEDWTPQAAEPVEREAPPEPSVPLTTPFQPDPSPNQSGSQQQQDSSSATTNLPPQQRECSNSSIFASGAGQGVPLTEQMRERQMREMREVEQRLREELSQDETETRPGIQRASLDDVGTPEDAERMTVRQLKEILANNFVDYRGCCEKHELVERVKRLWHEDQANKRRAAAAAMADATTTATTPNNTTPSATTAGEGGPPTTTSGEGPAAPTTTTSSSALPGSLVDADDGLCKICMDAPADCILLECGHMVTCTKCGKRLADCPICRQYISRVVHVFRS